MDPEERKTKQVPPWQFRPSPDLRELVGQFAVSNQLGPNEACKVLVALAMSELDYRHFGLIRQLAEALGGPDAFVRACTHIRSALEGARRATRNPIQVDPKHAVFIIETVQESLAAKGIQIQMRCLLFRPDELTEIQVSDGTSWQSEVRPEQRLKVTVAQD